MYTNYVCKPLWKSPDFKALPHIFSCLSKCSAHMPERMKESAVSVIIPPVRTGCEKTSF